MHIYRGTIPEWDEELARSADLGAMAHLAIATIARDGAGPTLEAQAKAVDRLLIGVRPVEKRAHRQNLRAAVMSYFSHLALPAHWQFVAAESRLGRGRVDLLWRHTDGRVLIDEVKVGHHRHLAASSVRSQVLEYVASGRDLWGPRFLGCRLLSTHNPASSTFTDTALHTVPLSSTSYRKDRP